MIELTTTNGDRLETRRLLGSGGQGNVYEALHHGQSVAVKVYHAHTADEAQCDNLERLVELRAPSASFLWPTELVTARAAAGKQTFGYVMTLREPRFRALEDLMARRVGTSFRALLTAAWQLADGYLRLHAKGLCYRDISFANVFFDPLTGDVRICDNDNVGVDGYEVTAVLGTPRFMAPEVVRGEARPSAETDRYSLAVLLFYMLMGGHPLDGEREAKIRCLDTPALERLYGQDPLYVFDPDDASNRPCPGVHDNPRVFHPMYPEAVRSTFLRAFTEGLRRPGSRVRESEWRRVFARALDGLVPCACGAQSMYDVDTRVELSPCWACGAQRALPPRIRVGESVVVLAPGARLFARHLEGTEDQSTPLAEVVPHPQVAGACGLRNLGVTPWTLTRADGSIAEVAPGRAAPIAAGNRLHFGRASGEIRV